MSSFNSLDWIILGFYFLGMMGIGVWFFRRSQSPEGFTAGGGKVPGWVCGLSIFATYLSSISYLALAGKSFTSNWNPFVFSLSIPIAAWIAHKFFIPYYRRSGQVSAYALLEDRFGVWARVYASGFYLVFQVARTAVVLYLMALPMQVIFGWNIVTVLLVTGAIVTIYSLLGGILAVLWSDAIQAIVLMVGALLCLYFILGDLPDGAASVAKAAVEGDKFSLGDYGGGWMTATVWVVLFYGIVENLRNFGIDQSYIQRYVASESETKAKRGLWLGALLYIPVSALFFYIGTSLFAYYGGSPEVPPQADIQEVREIVATRNLVQEGVAIDSVEYREKLPEAMGQVADGKLGDSVFPHFISHRLPHGLKGLLVAAIFAAAMSTTSTGLNSSATLLAKDFYRRFLRRDASPQQEMVVLRVGTVLWGVMGTALSLVFVSQTNNILDVWWKVAGILGAGTIGVFLVGRAIRKADNVAAIVATVAGFALVSWLTYLEMTDDNLVHGMVIPVVGVGVMLVVATVVSLRGRNAPGEVDS